MTELEKKLTEFFDDADEKQLGLLDVFPEEKLKNRACESIFSSAVRKAGIDMQENKTVKRTGKSSKRIVGLAIAAAVLATGAISAGAYAYTKFIHRQGVEHYLGAQTANELENSGLVFNEVSENEHIRVTLDTVLSDGQFAHMIFTVEKLDDEARSIVDCGPMAGVCYTDSDTQGEDIPMFVSGGMSWVEGIKNDPLDDSFSFNVDIHPHQADLSRKIKLKFHTTGDWDEPDIFDGIEFTPDVSKNVESVTMTADYGGEVTLLPCGLTGQHIQLPFNENEAGYGTHPYKWLLIRSDGTRKPLSEYSIRGSLGGELPDLFFFVEVKDFNDFDEYVGIEIDGVEYLKQ